MEKKNRNNLKNAISIAILLGGLFVGSLFVDLGQVMRGSGFSSKNLNKSDIFEANGKTWVAYGEPAIELKVVSDDACVKCDPSEALVWLRRVLPTIGARKISFDSEEGKKLIQEFGLTTLPAFVFDKDVDKTDFFTQAQVLFDNKDDQYVLKTQELGLTPGKYLTTPGISGDDAVSGNADAKVKVVMFSDFQCPFCKAFWSSFRDEMKEYDGKAVFVYKHFPLGIHPQANDAALAGECALEQDKFWEYADILYSSQKDWTNQNDIQKFKEYARNLKLDTGKFNQCLDSKKYQDRIDASVGEANSFGVSGTPATFINSQFINGVAGTTDLKAAIDEELAK
jgi:protein-disulfide isomerase